MADKQFSETPNDLTSPKGIPSGEDPNYHTAAEDAGENYFPQILKYTENVPQESILSRDNYSTSNQRSLISQPRKGKSPNATPTGPAKAPSRVKKYYNKNSPSKRQLSPMDGEEEPPNSNTLRKSGELNAT